MSPRRSALLLLFASRAAAPAPYSRRPHTAGEHVASMARAARAEAANVELPSVLPGHAETYSHGAMVVYMLLEAASGLVDADSPAAAAHAMWRVARAAIGGHDVVSDAAGEDAVDNAWEAVVPHDLFETRVLRAAIEGAGRRAEPSRFATPSTQRMRVYAATNGAAVAFDAALRAVLVATNATGADMQGCVADARNRVPRIAAAAEERRAEVVAGALRAAADAPTAVRQLCAVVMMGEALMEGVVRGAAQHDAETAMIELVSRFAAMAVPGA